MLDVIDAIIRACGGTPACDLSPEWHADQHRRLAQVGYDPHEGRPWTWPVNKESDENAYVNRVILRTRP